MPQAAATFRQWVKARDNAFSDTLYRLAKGALNISIPVIPGVHRLLYSLHRIVTGASANATRVFWYTPLFQSRLTRTAGRLFVYSGMPLVLGPVDITFGDDVRISGHTTISGRSATRVMPQLVVGSNVDIGWQTTIAVGTRVEIGDNVRIAGRAFLAGYPGHPVDAADRASGMPDLDTQAGDIVLEPDVWLATGVSVMAGVRIGRGTIVAAGSVVTKDLPPGVLAGGVPAIVLRMLPAEKAMS